MTERALEAVVVEGFSVEPSVSGHVLTAVLKGTGDTGAVAPLDAFLDAAAREVTRLGLRSVVFDLRALYLLNSSCLKTFLAFIFRLTSDGLGCGVRFVVDSKLGWQRRSLIALVRMAPAQVFIEDA
jgi:hypothetical protein